MGRHKWSSKEILVNPRTGVSKTVEEWADHLSLPVGTLMARLRRGHASLDDILNKARLRQGVIFFTDPSSGRSMSLNDWAQETGISQATLYGRIKNKVAPHLVLYPGAMNIKTHEMRRESRSNSGRKPKAKPLTYDDQVNLALVQMVREKADANVPAFVKLLDAAKAKVAQLATT